MTGSGYGDYDHDCLGQEFVAGRNAHRRGCDASVCEHRSGTAEHKAWMAGFESYHYELQRDAATESNAHRAEQTLQIVDERLKEFIGGKHGSMTTLQLLDRVFAEIKLSTPVAEVTALEARIASLEALLRRGSNSVRVECRTNIDQYRSVRWPKTLSCVPAIGDRIEGTEWDGKKVVACLRVRGITHALNGDQPYLSIELHR